MSSFRANIISRRKHPRMRNIIFTIRAAQDTEIKQFKIYNSTLLTYGYTYAKDNWKSPSKRHMTEELICRQEPALQHASIQTVDYKQLYGMPFARSGEYLTIRCTEWIWMGKRSRRLTMNTISFHPWIPLIYVLFQHLWMFVNDECHPYATQTPVSYNASGTRQLFSVGTSCHIPKWNGDWLVVVNFFNKFTSEW